MILVIMFSAASNIMAEITEIDGGSLYIVTNESSGSFQENGDFDKDYFWGGENISFTGMADDLYIMGRDIEISGKSLGSATMMGETVLIDGIITKNLHSAARDVRINGRVLETGFIGAQEVIISEDAVVEGTLLIGASTIHILGQLNNGLLAGAGEIIIDGPVKGNVNVRTGKLIITERGSVDGNLTYGSNNLLSSAEESRVSGTVQFEEDDNFTEEGFSTFGFIVKILFFAAIGITGLLILLFPGIKSALKKERTRGSYGKTILWGLLPLFTYPVATIITIPLFPLSIALGLAAFPLMGLATLLGLTLAGQFFFKLFKWESKNIFLQFLFAFGVFVILSLIPFIKVLAGLAAAAMGAGFLIGKLFKTDF